MSRTHTDREWATIKAVLDMFGTRRGRNMTQTKYLHHRRMQHRAEFMPRIAGPGTFMPECLNCTFLSEKSANRGDGRIFPTVKKVLRLTNELPSANEKIS